MESPQQLPHGRTTGPHSDPPVSPGAILSEGGREDQIRPLVRSAVQHLLSKSVPQTSWTVRAPGGPQRVQEAFLGNLRGVQKVGILGVAFSPSSCLVPEGVPVGYGSLLAQVHSLHSLCQPHPGSVGIRGTRGVRAVAKTAGRKRAGSGRQPPLPGREREGILTTVPKM